MKFKIHFTCYEGLGCLIIEGNTVEEIKEKADKELAELGGHDAWLEEIKE